MKTFAKSTRHAIRGIRYAFLHERNFQIEFFLALFAILLAFVFPLTPAERAAIFLVIGLVLSCELFNTATERIMDMLKPGIHPYVKMVKDLAAGAVLITSLLALFIGISVFLPHIMNFFEEI